MALAPNQIPKLANTPNGGFATLPAAVLGSFATNTNGQTIYTAGTNGGRIYAVLVSTNCSAVSSAFLYILRGATVIPLGMINNAINAGALAAGTTKNTDALNNVQILGLPFDNTGRPYIPLLPNDVVRVSAAVLANGSMTIAAMGADY